MPVFREFKLQESATRLLVETTILHSAQRPVDEALGGVRSTQQDAEKLRNVVGIRSVRPRESVNEVIAQRFPRS
jgi:hypothetical protein